MSRKKTILVHHFVGQMPLAGIAWQATQYLSALKRLGYDVWYVEDNGVNPYSPKENQLVWDSTYNIAYVRTMMERLGLGDRWGYWDPVKEGSWVGIGRERMMALYGEADALINLCGSTKLREEHMACPVRIPPPAKSAVLTCGQWSRPASLLIFGVRPNSPHTTIETSPSIPRLSRSSISAESA